MSSADATAAAAATTPVLYDVLRTLGLTETAEALRAELQQQQQQRQQQEQRRQQQQQRGSDVDAARTTWTRQAHDVTSDGDSTQQRQEQHKDGQHASAHDNGDDDGSSAAAARRALQQMQARVQSLLAHVPHAQADTLRTTTDTLAQLCVTILAAPPPLSSAQQQQQQQCVATSATTQDSSDTDDDVAVLVDAMQTLYDVATASPPSPCARQLRCVWLHYCRIAWLQLRLAEHLLLYDLEHNDDYSHMTVPQPRDRRDEGSDGDTRHTRQRRRRRRSSSDTGSSSSSVIRCATVYAATRSRADWQQRTRASHERLLQCATQLHEAVVALQLDAEVMSLHNNSNSNSNSSNTNVNDPTSVLGVCACATYTHFVRVMLPLWQRTAERLMTWVLQRTRPMLYSRYAPTTAATAAAAAADAVTTASAAAQLRAIATSKRALLTACMAHARVRLLLWLLQSTAELTERVQRDNDDNNNNSATIHDSKDAPLSSQLLSHACVLWATRCVQLLVSYTQHATQGRTATAARSADDNESDSDAAACVAAVQSAWQRQLRDVTMQLQTLLACDLHIGAPSPSLLLTHLSSASATSTSRNNNSSNSNNNVRCFDSTTSYWRSVQPYLNNDDDNDDNSTASRPRPRRAAMARACASLRPSLHTLVCALAQPTRDRTWHYLDQHRCRRQQHVSQFDRANSSSSSDAVYSRMRSRIYYALRAPHPCRLLLDLQQQQGPQQEGQQQQQQQGVMAAASDATVLLLDIQLQLLQHRRYTRHNMAAGMTHDLRVLAQRVAAARDEAASAAATTGAHTDGAEGSEDNNDDDDDDDDSNDDDSNNTNDSRSRSSSSSRADSHDSEHAAPPPTHTTTTAATTTTTTTTAAAAASSSASSSSASSSSSAASSTADHFTRTRDEVAAEVQSVAVTPCGSLLAMLTTRAQLIVYAMRGYRGPGRSSNSSRDDDSDNSDSHGGDDDGDDVMTAADGYAETLLLSATLPGTPAHPHWYEVASCVLHFSPDGRFVLCSAQYRPTAVAEGAEGVALVPASTGCLCIVSLHCPVAAAHDDVYDVQRRLYGEYAVHRANVSAARWYDARGRREQGSVFDNMRDGVMGSCMTAATTTKAAAQTITATLPLSEAWRVTARARLAAFHCFSCSVQGDVVRWQPASGVVVQRMTSAPVQDLVVSLLMQAVYTIDDAGELCMYDVYNDSVGAVHAGEASGARATRTSATDGNGSVAHTTTTTTTTTTTMTPVQPLLSIAVREGGLPEASMLMYRRDEAARATLPYSAVIEAVAAAAAEAAAVAGGGRHAIAVPPPPLPPRSSDAMSDNVLPAAFFAGTRVIRFRRESTPPPRASLHDSSIASAAAAAAASSLSLLQQQEQQLLQQQTQRQRRDDADDDDDDDDTVAAARDSDDDAPSAPHMAVAAAGSGTTHATTRTTTTRRRGATNETAATTGTAASATTAVAPSASSFFAPVLVRLLRSSIQRSSTMLRGLTSEQSIYTGRDLIRSAHARRVAPPPRLRVHVYISSSESDSDSVDNDDDDSNVDEEEVDKDEDGDEAMYDDDDDDVRGRGDVVELYEDADEGSDDNEQQTQQRRRRAAAAVAARRRRRRSSNKDEAERVDAYKSDNDDDDDSNNSSDEASNDDDDADVSMSLRSVYYTSGCRLFFPCIGRALWAVAAGDGGVRAPRHDPRVGPGGAPYHLISMSISSSACADDGGSGGGAQGEAVGRGARASGDADAQYNARVHFWLTHVAPLTAERTTTTRRTGNNSECGDDDNNNRATATATWRDAWVTALSRVRYYTDTSPTPTLSTTTTTTAQRHARGKCDIDMCDGDVRRRHSYAATVMRRYRRSHGADRLTPTARNGRYLCILAAVGPHRQLIDRSMPLEYRAGAYVCVVFDTYCSLIRSVVPVCATRPHAGLVQHGMHPMHDRTCKEPLYALPCSLTVVRATYTQQTSDTGSTDTKTSSSSNNNRLQATGTHNRRAAAVAHADEEMVLLTVGALHERVYVYNALTGDRIRCLRMARHLAPLSSRMTTTTATATAIAAPRGVVASAQPASNTSSPTSTITNDDKAPSSLSATRTTTIMGMSTSQRAQEQTQSSSSSSTTPTAPATAAVQRRTVISAAMYAYNNTSKVAARAMDTATLSSNSDNDDDAYTNSSEDSADDDANMAKAQSSRTHTRDAPQLRAGKLDNVVTCAGLRHAIRAACALVRVVPTYRLAATTLQEQQQQHGAIDALLRLRYIDNNDGNVQHENDKDVVNTTARAHAQRGAQATRTDANTCALTRQEQQCCLRALVRDKHHSSVGSCREPFALVALRRNVLTRLCHEQQQQQQQQKDAHAQQQQQRKPTRRLCAGVVNAIATWVDTHTSTIYVVATTESGKVYLVHAPLYARIV